MAAHSEYYAKLKSLRAVAFNVEAEEVLPVITRIAGTSILSQYMWRGQSRIEWEPVPTLYRRISRSGHKMTPALVKGLERELCTAASDLSYGRGSPSTTLAHLQHYGAATRLLDVTRDPAIALWFAVSETLDADFDGVVFGFDVSRMRDATLELDRPQYAEPDEPEGPRLLDCLPNDRQLQQRAAFLVPKVTKGDYEDLLPPTPQFATTWLDATGSATSNPPPPVVAIRIARTAKNRLRRILSVSYGMTSNYLFPDLAGFCASHATSIGITPEELPHLATRNNRATLTGYPCLIVVPGGASSPSRVLYGQSRYEEFLARATLPLYEAQDRVDPWMAIQLGSDGRIDSVYVVRSHSSTGADLEPADVEGAAELVGLYILDPPSENTWVFSESYPRTYLKSLAVSLGSMRSST